MKEVKTFIVRYVGGWGGGMAIVIATSYDDVRKFYNYDYAIEETVLLKYTGEYTVPFILEDNFYIE